MKVGKEVEEHQNNNGRNFLVLTTISHATKMDDSLAKWRVPASLNHTGRRTENVTYMSFNRNLMA